MKEMRQDLDTLCSEIEKELAGRSFAVFRGHHRALENRPQVDWDVVKWPDFLEFLGCAEKLGVRLLVFSNQKLTEQLLDQARERLDGADLAREEHREFGRTFSRLRAYEGFTSSIELSFDYEAITYIFHISTPWYDELLDMIDDLDDSIEQAALEDDGENPMGGYFSQN
jgi:hypothetical protein